MRSKKASKKAAPGPQLVPPAADTLEADIDELGELRGRLAANAALIATMVAKEKMLTARLAARYESAPAEEVLIIESSRYVLKVGAKANQQKFVPGGLRKVIDWLGFDRVLPKLNITFESLNGLLDEQQYKEVVTDARTGRRNLTVVAKAEPLKAA